MEKTFPPGPQRRFFGMNHIRGMQRDILGFCIGLKRDYGDIVGYQAGPIWMFQFTHPDQIQEVLVKQARKLHKPNRIKAVFGQWDGEGLLLSEGDFWARQRRLIQTAFHPRRVRNYAETIVEQSGNMLARWASQSEVNAVDEMPRLTLDIVGRTLFDTDLARDAQGIAAAVDVLQEITMLESSRLMPVPNWLPTSVNRRKRESIRTLHSLIERLIRERRASGRDHGDLLSMLLLAKDVEEDGWGMSDTQVRDEATTLLLAGHETTAVSLMWTLYYLATHLEVQEQIAAAIDKKIGDRPPTIDDLTSLPLVEMAFKEALRLRGPVYFFGREAVEPLEIAGVQIPAGSHVNLVPYITHHDARWFENPEEFRPERFLPEREEQLPRFAYFPFGGGPRVCIGKGMATLEATLVLVSIFQRYRIELAAGQGDPGMEAQVSLHPKGPLRLKLTKRASS